MGWYAIPPIQMSLHVPRHVRQLDHLAHVEQCSALPIEWLAFVQESEYEQSGTSDHVVAIAQELVPVGQHTTLSCEHVGRPGHAVGHRPDQLTDRSPLLNRELPNHFVNEVAPLHKDQVKAVPRVARQGLADSRRPC